MPIDSGRSFHAWLHRVSTRRGRLRSLVGARPATVCPVMSIVWTKSTDHTTWIQHPQWWKHAVWWRYAYYYDRHRHQSVH